MNQVCSDPTGRHPIPTRCSITYDTIRLCLHEWTKPIIPCCISNDCSKMSRNPQILFRSINRICENSRTDDILKTEPDTRALLQLQCVIYWHQLLSRICHEPELSVCLPTGKTDRHDLKLHWFDWLIDWFIHSLMYIPSLLHANAESRSVKFTSIALACWCAHSKYENTK